MKPYLIILTTSIIYAIIRAFHDSHISNGKWKIWAFVEGVFAAALTSGLLVWRTEIQWWYIFVLGPLFAFYFWLVFDCAQGYMRTKNILHLGELGFDAKMRETFLYDAPIWGWENTGAIRLIMVKCLWLLLLTGIYFSLLNTY